MRSRKAEAFLPAIGVVGLVAIWSLVTWRQWVDPVLLPSPVATFDSLWHGLSGPLGVDFLKTVYRTAASTLIAAIIAIPLGIVLGSFVGVLLLFVLPVTLMGAVSPFAVRLAISNVSEAGSTEHRRSPPPSPVYEP